MAYDQKRVIDFAKKLAPSRLTEKDLQWLHNLCDAISQIFHWQNSQVNGLEETTQACLAGVKSLFQLSRLPTDCSILLFSQLAELGQSLQCSINSDSHSDDTGRFILIGGICDYTGPWTLDQIESELGNILFVRDPLKNVLPCVALDVDPLVCNHVFICKSWRYIPNYHSISAEHGTPRSIPGHLEIWGLTDLQRDKSSLFRSAITKEMALNVEKAFDGATQRFKKRWIERQEKHLIGRVTRISALAQVSSGQCAQFIELTSESQECSTTLAIFDSPQCRPVLSMVHLLRTNQRLIATHLQTSVLRLRDLNPVNVVVATSRTVFIVIDSSDDEPNQNDQDGDSKVHFMRKQARTKDDSLEPDPVRRLATYSGLVTEVTNSHCFKLDSRYFVHCHRHAPTLGLRKGTKLKLVCVHVISDYHIGLCSQSRIELLDFGPFNEVLLNSDHPSSVTPGLRPPMIQAGITRLEEGQEHQEGMIWRPTLRLCTLLEVSRSYLLRIWQQHAFLTQELRVAGIPQLAYLLKRIDKDQLLPNSSFSPCDLLHEWFAHDSGTLGSSIGCQALGTLIEHPLSIEAASHEITQFAQHFPPVKSTSLSWNYCISNSQEYFESFGGLLIGQLVCHMTETHVSSNFAYFEDYRHFRLPIVVPGLALCHIGQLCSISNFLIIRESTVHHHGPELGVPRASNPFALYLFCDIESVRFLFPPRNATIRNPKISFTVLKKELPKYEKFEDVSSLVFDLRAQVSGHNGDYCLIGFEDIQLLHLHPLIEEGKSYAVAEALIAHEDKGKPTRWIVKGTCLAELDRPLIKVTDSPNEERLESLRDTLWSEQKKQAGRVVSFYAVIMARSQESVLQDSYTSTGIKIPGKYVSGVVKEFRSNSGQITLELRALHTPDTVRAYFNPQSYSLPLGLVPGMIVYLKRVNCLQLRKRATIKFSADSAIIPLGLYPSLAKSLLFPTSEHLSSMHLPDIENLPTEEAVDQIHPSISSPSLSSSLVDGVDWTSQDIPYCYLSNLPSKGVDKRVYKLRATLSKVYHFHFETHCSSCSRLSAHGICSYGCATTGMNVYLNLKGMVHDGTGSAVLSSRGVACFSLLGVSMPQRLLLTSAIELLSSVRYDDGIVTYVSPKLVALDGPEDEHKLSFDQRSAILDLVAKLKNNLSESVILYFTFFEKELEQQILPVNVVKKSKAEPNTSLDNVKLSMPTPMLDLVWAIRTESRIAQECTTALSKLKLLDPSLFSPPL